MPKEELKKEFDLIMSDLPKFKDFKDETLFTALCLKYFFSPEEFNFTRFKECFADGKNDGGIDLVVVNDFDHYSATLSLVQCKFVNELKNKQDIIDIFTKIQQTYEDFLTDKTAVYNAKLKRILKDKLDYVEDLDNIVELVLFISIDCSDDRKNEINSALEDISYLGEFVVRVVYLDEIKDQIEYVKNPKRFVDEAKIKINKSDGILKYKEQGILVNISANSLRDLYDRFRDKGLFEQNFRYFVRNKKIDTNIRESLKRKRHDFWFLNNGIIISCKDFVPDSDNIKLYDFSVVNGCQTTTLIGEYKENNQYEDFYLPCKIIKPQTDDENEFSRFMSEIAEASNSQKPISDRDLKANRPEQRRLQQTLKQEEPFIYLEIKRGEKVKRGIAEWQKIKNDELGQYILAFNLQQPGTARNGKRKIFSSDKTYRSVFLRKTFSKENVVDLLKLKDFYGYYVEKQLREDKFSDLEQESVARNGKFMVIALIGLFVKYKRGLLSFKGYSKSENWIEELEKDNLTGRIFEADSLSNDFDKKLNGLFQLIIAELSILYRIREKEEKNVSNFFKADTKYQQIIIKHFIDNVFNNDYRMESVTHFLSIFE